jgi:hypothetical protein
VLPASANGRNSWVEVRNIFCETQIFAFSHGLGQEETVVVSLYVCWRTVQPRLKAYGDVL